MNIPELITSLKSCGAKFYPAASARDIDLANSGLQARRRAMFPGILREFYATTNAANLDSGYIFGPTETERGVNYPIPGIVQINDDFSRAMPDKSPYTIFGRNDLFFFAFDAFGTFYMLENLNLRVLRKYEDGMRAISDCLMGGRL